MPEESGGDRRPQGVRTISHAAPEGVARVRGGADREPLDHLVGNAAVGNDAAGRLARDRVAEVLLEEFRRKDAGLPQVGSSGTPGGRRARRITGRVITGSPS